MYQNFQRFHRDIGVLFELREMKRDSEGWVGGQG